MLYIYIISYTFIHCIVIWCIIRHFMWLHGTHTKRNNIMWYARCCGFLPTERCRLESCINMTMNNKKHINGNLLVWNHQFYYWLPRIHIWYVYIDQQTWTDPVKNLYMANWRGSCDANQMNLGNEIEDGAGDFQCSNSRGFVIEMAPGTFVFDEFQHILWPQKKTS